MFAHCDVNAFYASCQTAFRPDLKGRPVVVLSNNDGCVIARSAEAKPFVKMGEPYFKQKAAFLRHGVVAFSSNYELYARHVQPGDGHPGRAHPALRNLQYR